MQERGPAAYLAEFFGTLILVFFITGVVSVYVGKASADFAVVGLVHAFVLFVLIQTLALVSGAHFNPAVTVALAALREIRAADAIIYILAQLAGAAAGALLTKVLLDNLPNADSQHFGAVGIGPALDGKVGLGMLGEFIGTFILVWAIVGVAVNPQAPNDWAAFAIGATLGFAVMVIGPLTGAGLNPARSFGPALVSDHFGGAKDFLLAYVLAPLLGGLAAAFTYFNIFIAPGAKGPEGAEPVG